MTALAVGAELIAWLLVMRELRRNITKYPAKSTKPKSRQTKKAPLKEAGGVSLSKAKS
jgi:hypothetical protein